MDYPLIDILRKVHSFIWLIHTEARLSISPLTFDRYLPTLYVGIVCTYTPLALRGTSLTGISADVL